MNTEDTFANELSPLIGTQVVVDVDGPLVYIGTLEEIHSNTLLLVDADAHDLRETATSTDRYLIQTCQHGIRANRRSVTVMARHVVSISPLDAVITY